MSQQQESQQPTSEPPTDLIPEVIVISCWDEDLYFGNDPNHSHVSNTEFSSLVLGSFCSDAGETSAGISCGDPNCPRTHKQSEVDLLSHINSGRISFDRCPKPIISLASIRSGLVEGSHSLEESEKNPEEGSNVEHAEESKLDPRTENTREGSSTLTSETPARKQGRAPVV